MKKTIDLINDLAFRLKWLDCSVQRFKQDELVVSGSDDMAYYHNFEILFQNVHFYTGVFNWKWDCADHNDLITIIEDKNLKLDINKKFRVEQGNILLKFNNQDNLDIIVGCHAIEFSDKVVKYF